MGTLFGNSFGSSVDPSEAMYDPDTGAPENLTALRLDAEYDPETGEPINQSAVQLEKLYDEFAERQDFDFGKAATAIGKIGDYEPPRPVPGSRPPSLPSMGRGRVSGMTGERPYPYAAPSYLAGSVDYNKLVGQLVNTLLKGNIRPRRINPLL
jgi:hypothetical protein